LCINLSSTNKRVPPTLLNHLTAPNVVVISAVAASTALPGLIPNQKLKYKDADGNIQTFQGKDQVYIDGTIQDDIPASVLAETLNCRFFVAGQVNPHIIPFFYHANGSVGGPCQWVSGTQEEGWRGGYLLSALEAYLKIHLKVKFQFLEALGERVGFTQDFHGSVTLIPHVKLIDYLKVRAKPVCRD
jgi:predicted acylesterase/phospholipase RssA